MAESLGDRIRAVREQYGMTQTALAQRAGISKQQMYLIENNKTRDPGVLKIKKIAQTLRVSADYLLGLVDERSVVA